MKYSKSQLVAAMVGYGKKGFFPDENTEKSPEEIITRLLLFVEPEPEYKNENGKFTWGELREFCNTLPEEHLNKPVVINFDCRDSFEYAEPLLTEAMYMHRDDNDDIYDEETFLSEKESGGIENPEDYVFYPAGRPFLVVLEENTEWQRSGKVVLPESENTADNPY